MEYAYLLTVSLQPQDEDLAGKVPDYIRAFLHGSAVTVTACDPVNALDVQYRAGYRAAVTKIAEG